MPAFGHTSPDDHDWCFATKMCRRCGASQAAVASGERAERCEPGVTGISWLRRAERIRDLMWPWGGAAVGDNIKPVSASPTPVHSPMLDLPVYRLEDFAGLAGKRADLVIVDDPEPPSAA